MKVQVQKKKRGIRVAAAPSEADIFVQVAQQTIAETLRHLLDQGPGVTEVELDGEPLIITVSTSRTEEHLNADG